MVKRRRLLPALAGWTLAVSLTLTTAPSAAQTSAHVSNDAAALAESARDKTAAKDWSGAIADYQRLEQLRGQLAWDEAANYSQALFQQNRLAEAATQLRSALRLLPSSEPSADELRAKFQARMNEILPLVAQLAVTVSRPGARLLLDGKEIGRSPLRDVIYVTPGTREIQARLEGFQTGVWHRDVPAGEVMPVNLQLTPTSLDEPRPAAPKSTDDEDGALSDVRLGLGITGLLVGSGGVVASIVLGLASADRGDQAASLQTSISADPRVAGGSNFCGAGSPLLSETSCSELDGVLSEQQTFRGAAIGSGVAGGLLLVGGLLTLLVPSASVQPAAAVDTTSASVSLRGLF